MAWRLDSVNVMDTVYMSWFNYTVMNRSSLVSATVLIIIVGNHVFILVALTQSVVIWFTWDSYLII